MQAFQPNDTINNRYRVVRKLGAGAMGSVYLCEDSVENNIKVALKVLISENLEDQDVWAKGEYEALTRLRHPNLARVHNFGRIGDTKDYFIVSEFIKGIDLYSATEYLRYDELVDIIVQICRALEYIHSQGYVHFDIKPDNILVTRYKTIGIKEGSKVQYNEADLAADKELVHAKPLVKLIDFGLAEKITGSFSFAIKGTLNYLAPEILGGQTPDKRADLYSLGVTLYQVANRDLPFFQDAAFGGPAPAVTKRSELFGMHMKKHPEFLRGLIMKLLEENVEERFQSAKEVIQFINKNSEYHFDLETPETRDCYFYSSKLVGRRREINLLKDSHERIFFPQLWKEGHRVDSREDEAEAEAEGTDATTESTQAPGSASPAAEAGAQDGEAAAQTEVPSSHENCAAMVLVSGEMGSGKSRLLEEFQHYLKLKDFAYFSGNCYEANRKAYQPFIEILRQVVYALGFESEIYVKYRPEVSKLLPELRDKSEAEGDGDHRTRLDKEKLCFIDRMSQLLLEAATAYPYVCAINNLHWVDDASLDVLESIFLRIDDMVKSQQPVKFLMLTSLRPEEPVSDRLRDLLDKWKEGGLCREVQVRRLKYSQIQEFLRSMLNFTDVPEAFVSKLMERTGGNPLFVVETLKTLEDDGVIRNAGGNWVIKATNFDRIDIPHRMDDMLGKRLEKLDATKRDLLEVLSVIDKPVNPKVIQNLKRFADAPILVELRTLEQTGIIMKTFEGGKLHFQIAQPKVREIVYTRIPEEKRQKYHGEVGALYQEIYRDKEEEILEELAYHYQHSDQPAKAVEMAIKAGDGLKRIYANERAYEYYTYVLDKVDGDAASFDLWVTTHEKVGDLCTIMGRYDMADRSYSLLLDEEIRARLDSQRVIKIFLARGKIFEIQGDYDLALKCYKDAKSYLANFKQDELVVERVRVFNSIGWAYVCMGKYEKAMAISLEALRVIEGAPDKIEHAMLYNTIGSANYFKGNYVEAIDYHRRSLQIKENLENIPEITSSLNNLASAYMANTDYGEALELFQRALKTSEEIGDPYGKAISLHNFARLYFAVGHNEKGWECLDESLKLSKLHNMRYLNVQNYLVRGKALMDSGECSKAEGNYFRALTAFSKQANRWGLCTVLLQFAALRRLTGNHKEALSMVTEARQYASELDIHNLQALGLLEEARLRREEGEDGVKKALALVEDAKVIAERCGHPELTAEVFLEMGETQVRLRRLPEATQSYEKAEEKYREILDNLSPGLKESYQARLKVKFPSWKGGQGARSEPPAPLPSEGVVAAVTPGQTEPAKAAAPPRSRAEDSLERVNALMVSLLSGGKLKGFLEKMLEDILDILGGETAYFLFVHADSLTVEASRAAGGKSTGEPENVICLKLVERVLTSKRPLLLADTADDPSVAREIEAQGITCASVAIASVPIEAGRDCVLYVINPQLPKGGGEGSFRALMPFLNLVPIAYHQLVPEAVPASP